MYRILDEQGKVSPVILIAGGLAVAVLAYTFLAPPPGAPAPVALDSPAATIKPSQPGAPAPGVITAPKISPSSTSPPEAADANTTRDPFAPGKVAILTLKNSNSESSPLYVRPSPGSNSIPLKSPEAGDDKPAFKGSAKTETGQVAIVVFKKKSYLLQIGDRLPGTEYRLTEIQANAILLSTGSEQLRLTKKGEAK